MDFIVAASVRVNRDAAPGAVGKNGTVYWEVDYRTSITVTLPVPPFSPSLQGRSLPGAPEDAVRGRTG
jgi:hypothetical protein